MLSTTQHYYSSQSAVTVELLQHCKALVSAYSILRPVFQMAGSKPELVNSQHCNPCRNTLTGTIHQNTSNPRILVCLPVANVHPLAFYAQFWQTSLKNNYVKMFTFGPTEGVT